METQSRLCLPGPRAWLAALPLAAHVVGRASAIVGVVLCIVSQHPVIHTEVTTSVACPSMGWPATPPWATLPPSMDPALISPPSCRAGSNC